MAGMIVTPEIESYLQRLQPSPDPVLEEMERVAEQRQFPIIGPLVGRLCEQLARAIGARSVFEMGSGFGYSTYWFARAVPPSGQIIHTDADPANGAEAAQWLARGGLAERVRCETGDACAILRRHPGPFDIVFIDIDKEAYPEALELALPRVRSGGLIITDNVLWYGRVAEPASADPATRAILEYTRRAFSAPELLTTLLPLRDGVAVSLKR
jgi:caffeoyl-CoA O-methyltransferase